jgi:hypothetical protein
MARPIPPIVQSSRLLVRVLQGIVQGRSTSALIKDGYSYWQISEVLNLASSLDYLGENNGTPSITDEGLKFLRNSPRRSFSILPRLDQRIATIGLDEPYLPGRRTLEALKNRTSN